MPGTSYYDEASTVYYPFDVASAKAALEAAGLTDTDGNGFVNLAGGGADVNVTLLTQSDYETDKNLAEGVVAMMGDVGVKVTLICADRQGLRQRPRQRQVRLDRRAQRDRADHRGAEHHEAGTGRPDRPM